MQIQRYSDSDKAVWDDFVGRSKNGTFLFSRDYMDYHRDRFPDHSLLIWNDRKNRLQALLPAHKEGPELDSHAGLTYGGFITDDAMKTSRMVNVFRDTLAYLRDNDFKTLVYKTVPSIYHRVPAEEDRYVLFIGGAELIRRNVLTVISDKRKVRFQERRRRGVKKALKNKLTVRSCDDFESYWPVLEATVREVYDAKPVHTLEEILKLQARFPDNIRLWICCEGDALLAGVVLYESDFVVRAQYIAASPRGRETGALDLIFDRLITAEYPHKAYFDFGASNLHNSLYLKQGLIDQKEGFGARAVMHDHYRIDLDLWSYDRVEAAMQ